MTNRNPKRRPSGYREAPAQAAPERRSFFGSLLTPPPPGSTPMPRLRTTLARGVAMTLSTPVLVFGVPIALLLAWFALLATGFQGPFTLMYGALAVPPIGTAVDTQLSGEIFRRGALAGFGVFVLILLRSIVIALIATVSVERFRTGRVSGWALRRVLRVVPTTFTISFAGLAIMIVGQFLGFFLGAGIGLLAFVASITAGVYLFAFAPAVAADEDRGLTDTVRRAVRVGRMPGSSNLWLAVMYAVGSYALLLGAAQAGTIGVNPSATAWAVAVVANLLHVAIEATFVFRYLSVAALTPDPPPVPRSAARGRR